MTSVTLPVRLKKRFAAAQVDAILKHFGQMGEEFTRGAWEEAVSKSGKLVEAVSKALYLHVGRSLPPARKFKVGTTLGEIEALAAGSFDDSVRITMPRACRFIYDISSNRGARHDPTEIDANEMDANATVACSKWLVGELLRYAEKGAPKDAELAVLLYELTRRSFPAFEQVDGRMYFHQKGLSARDVALLALHRAYPGRLSRDVLIETICRHRHTKGNAAVALARLSGFVDVDHGGGYRLLQPGVVAAEQVYRCPTSQGRKAHSLRVKR
jgi:hypothetical protein